MSNVLVVGNILKDVYLRLDERRNKFELGEDGTPWLDLAFNGSTTKFFRRSSIYGGAAVALEVLNRFGQNARIAGSKLGFVDGEIVPNGQEAKGYRYMLCRGNRIAYLTSNDAENTEWVNPTELIDWIYFDRTTGVTDELIEGLKSFLSMSTHTRVAVYLPHDASEKHKQLLQFAEMVFTDGSLKKDEFKGAVCEITDRDITLSGTRQIWRIERTDLMTHLTCHSIIAASVFGALLSGKSVRDSLLYAKVNVENSTLAGSLSIEKVAELAENQKSDQIDISMIAAQLMTPGKGILAADESGGSIKKKFAQLNIPDDEQHRRDYRNIFLSTPELERYVNGVILFDETTKQKSDDGRDFVSYLTAHGIIPGVKVDQGLVNFSNSDEKYTEGLENLAERLAAYYDAGLRFAKWRAAFEIKVNPIGIAESPTEMAIQKNAEILAEYAKICQAANIVPIVEPEVVYDGNYTLEQSIDITSKILDAVFDELSKQNVLLEGCILKVNMVLAGKKYPIQSSPEEVGRATANVLRAHVPERLAGVVFLSGGQSPEQATEDLQAVTNNGPFPWPVTFSFARALQDPALFSWQGNNANKEIAQLEFKKRLVANTQALKKNN